MMCRGLWVAVLFEADFWTEKKYTDWSLKEVQQILKSSPCAQAVAMRIGIGGMGGVAAWAAAGAEVAVGGALFKLNSTPLTGAEYVGAVPFNCVYAWHLTAVDKQGHESQPTKDLEHLDPPSFGAIFAGRAAVKEGRLSIRIE